MDAAGGLLDTPDHLRQLLGGGIGVVAHRGEDTMEIALHPRTQVAIGQCAEQARDLGDADRVGIEQGIELLRQLQEKALFPSAIDALGKIAGSGAAHHVGHVDFDTCLGGAVAPFANKPQMRTGIVANGRDVLGDAGCAVVHLALGSALAIQALIDLGVLCIADFQQRDRLADQIGRAIERRRAGMDIVCIGVQQILHAIGVDDGEVGVGDVHAGGGVIQCGADAQVFGRDAAFAL